MMSYKQETAMTPLSETSNEASGHKDTAKRVCVYDSPERSV